MVENPRELSQLVASPTSPVVEIPQKTFIWLLTRSHSWLQAQQAEAINDRTHASAHKFPLRSLIGKQHDFWLSEVVLRGALLFQRLCQTFLRPKQGHGWVHRYSALEPPVNIDYKLLAALLIFSGTVN